MRRIVIPTDFSENAMNAIRYAMEIFKYDRTDIIILHAYADEVYENTREMRREFFEEFKEKVREASDRTLRKIVAEMLTISPNPKHNYDFKSVFGSLVDVTNDLVDKENLDLIVMGTRGKTDDRSITFGSNTLQVIKYVKCPVLAVPHGYHGKKLDHILFPTDFLIPYKRRELKLVSTLAKEFCAEIKVLYMTKWEKLFHRQLDNRSFLEHGLKDNPVEHLNLTGEDLTETINHSIKKFDADLLVMVNTRHSYMEHLLYTSTIEKIGLDVKIPFLILQNLPR